MPAEESRYALDHTRRIDVFVFESFHNVQKVGVNFWLRSESFLHMLKIGQRVFHLELGLGLRLRSWSWLLHGRGLLHRLRLWHPNSLLRLRCLGLQQRWN